MAGAVVLWSALPVGASGLHSDASNERDEESKDSTAREMTGFCNRRLLFPNRFANRP